ncbi:MAG: Hsp70 family protein [Clostridiales bacterium]|nr:Hsp70 family protein [Clostridiales bacterium]
MGDLYLGIDLGTTNSVIAYGNLTPRGDLKCKVIDVDRKSDTGGRVRRTTLPSVVYYSIDSKTREITPDVGDYAKSRYGIMHGYVSKSIKSSMGSRDSLNLSNDIMDKTPAEVSSRILSFLMYNAKTRLMQEDLTDAIITVPASFDSDKCQDTIDAARLAGINVDNVHDILLYEPKAVIYDFIHMQEMGEIPSNLIDFSTPKNILVFDLGGGTLDVSIHKVSYSDNGMMNIEDIAIARYTSIGGDDFDELLAKDLYKRFERLNCIRIPESRREEVMCKLRIEAEKLKMTMSDAYEQCQSLGKEFPMDHNEEVMQMNVYDSYSIMEAFSLEEMMQILSPLMGEELSRKDVNRIDSLDQKQMNNIIYPILDVLAKANSDIKIDHVLLNGGMTKFFPIKKRIDQFFGLDSLVTADPDLSVARGAVYYHYCLHKYNVKRQSINDLAKNMIRSCEVGETEQVIASTMSPMAEAAQTSETAQFNTGTILNDTINLGVTGEYVSKLVGAGTKLPYCSGEIAGKYTFSQYTNQIAIEIFLGRGKTKNLPNRRIADRIITFKEKHPTNTPISLNIIVDSMRMMRVEAWITGNIEEKALITLDTNSNRTEHNKKPTAKIYTKEAKVLNAKSELNQIKTLSENSMKHGKGISSEKMHQILDHLSCATNPKDFFDPMMESLSRLGLSELLRGFYYTIAIELAKGWDPKQQRRMLNVCKQHFSENFAGFRHDNYVMKQAILFICTYDPNAVDFLTTDLIRNRYSFYENVIFNSILMHTDYSEQKMKYLSKQKLPNWELKEFTSLCNEMIAHEDEVSKTAVEYLLHNLEEFTRKNSISFLKEGLNCLEQLNSDGKIPKESYGKMIKVLRNMKHELANDEIYDLIHMIDIQIV